MDPASPFDAEADLADLALLFDADHDYAEESPKDAKDEKVLALIDSNGVVAPARGDYFARAARDSRDSDYFNEDDLVLNDDAFDQLEDPSYDPQIDVGTNKKSSEYVGRLSRPPSSSKTKKKKKKKTKTTEQFPQKCDELSSGPFPTASETISATPDSSSFSSTTITPKPLTTRLEERFLNTSGTAKTEAWKGALLKKTLAHAAKAAGLSTLIPMSAKSGVLIDRLTGQFHCEICGARYRHNTSLSRHRRIDHPR